MHGRFLVRPRHPLTRRLLDTFGGGSDKNVRKERNRIGDRFGRDDRNDIVSESLCDDTIKYLAPTLEKHKGCTIIDIHPGACLWSSKLHDYLKPKRHLLMEPDPQYDPFIKPLLARPDSTYRHTLLSGAHPQQYWGNFHTVLSKPELAPVQPVAESDPRSRQLDPNVLVIGNLARVYRTLRRVNSVAFATMILQQACRASLANELYHRSGLIRMLWWVPEAEKLTLFPTTEVFTKAANTMFSCTSSMNEVVGCSSLFREDVPAYYRRRRRPEILEAYTAKQVEDSTKELGMSRPEGREFLYKWPEKDLSTLASPLETAVNTASGLEAEMATVRSRLERTNDLISRASAVAANEKSAKRALLPKEQALLDTLAFPQCNDASATFQSRNVRLKYLAILSDLALQVIRLEVGYKVLEEKGDVDGAKLEELRRAIMKLGDKVTEVSSKRDARNGDYVSQIVDEEICVFSKPPILAFEARKHEALKADSTDFWPQNELMLLDIVPKPRDLAVPDLAKRSDGATLLNMLVRNTMESPKVTLETALDRIAPNAAQDLLPMIPAATDPRKGGRLNPKMIRCRMVSEDILEGLVKAWVEWPFRPMSMELELAAETEVAVEAVEGEEDEGEAAEDGEERKTKTKRGKGKLAKTAVE